jgi:hypothetical protein
MCKIKTLEMRKLESCSIALKREKEMCILDIVVA